MAGYEVQLLVLTLTPTLHFLSTSVYITCATKPFATERYFLIPSPSRCLSILFHVSFLFSVYGQSQAGLKQRLERVGVQFGGIFITVKSQARLFNVACATEPTV